MPLIKIFICLSFGLVFGANPDWSRKSYIVTGILYLDYGQIAEPFQAWIDNSTEGIEKSRIDYYSGYNTIIYDNGLGYKIIPDKTPVSDLIFHEMCIKRPLIQLFEHNNKFNYLNITINRNNRLL